MYSTIDMVQIECSKEGCSAKAWSVIFMNDWLCDEHYHNPPCSEDIQTSDQQISCDCDLPKESKDD